MAPGNNEKLDLLPDILDKDEKVDGKVSAENQSLHPVRIRKFMDDNAIKLDNFDEKFNFETALSLLRVKKTGGEAYAEGKMLKLKEYLDTVGRSDWIEETNENNFKTKLHTELTERNQLDLEADLMESYRLYHTVRKLALRSLKIKEQTSKELEGQKEGKDSGEKKNYQEDAENFLVKMKDRFMDMDAKEKLILVGTLVIGGFFLSKWDSDAGKKVKQGVFGVLKAAGAAVGINYMWKLFSGKTALEAFSEDKKVKELKTDEFWTKNFDTDKEKAHALQKSFVFLGDQKFADLALQYKKARGGSHEVKMVGVDEKQMSPKEVYAALDIFFSKFEKKTSIDEMVRKYPNATWMVAAGGEMAEAGWLEFDEGTYARAKKEIDEKATDAFDWLYTAGGIGPTLKKWYMNISGAEDFNEDAYKNWAKEFFNENVRAKEVDVKKFIEQKFMHEPKRSLAFKTLYESADPANVDAATGVKFSEVAGDSMYVISTVKLNFLGGDKEKIKEQILKAESQVKDFLKKKYPGDAPNIEKFMQISQGLRVAENSTYVLFARMPLKGTAEYHAIDVGKGRQPIEKEKRSTELLTEANKFNYTEMMKTEHAWQAEKLRVRFLMDSTQTAELQEILDWFNKKYLGGKPVKRVDVMDKIFTSDEDMAEALENTHVKQNLKGNINLLKGLESRIDDIERDAAKDVIGVGDEYEQIVSVLKKEYGYRVRLAIIGDPEARAALKYDPRIEGNTVDGLLEEYEKMCEKYVKDRNEGRI